MSNAGSIRETRLTVISEDTQIEGKIRLEGAVRIHGVILGEVQAAEGSKVVLGETSMIEGTIIADTLHIDGFVRGNIIARTKVCISGTGRVIGNIQAPSLSVDFGAYFEGESRMEETPSSEIKTSPRLSPA